MDTDGQNWTTPAKFGQDVDNKKPSLFRIAAPTEECKAAVFAQFALGGSLPLGLGAPQTVGLPGGKTARTGLSCPDGLAMLPRLRVGLLLMKMIAVVVFRGIPRERATKFREQAPAERRAASQ
jgi:hypothetical protein